MDVFIDGFAYFSLFPYIIYDHLKRASRLRATLYVVALTITPYRYGPSYHYFGTFHSTKEYRAQVFPYCERDAKSLSHIVLEI